MSSTTKYTADPFLILSPEPRQRDDVNSGQSPGVDRLNLVLSSNGIDELKAADFEELSFG